MLETTVGVVGADGQVTVDSGEPSTNGPSGPAVRASRPSGDLVVVAGLGGEVSALEMGPVRPAGRPYEVVGSGNGFRHGERLGSPSCSAQARPSV